MAGKLTKTDCDGAAPIIENGTARRSYVWDGELKGFGLRMSERGVKTFIVQYRLGGGGRRSRKVRETIGRYGPVWTVDKARKEALRRLGIAVTGQDPAAERKANREAVTLGELCDTYIAAAEKGEIRTRSGRPKRASTLATDKGRIARHIKPLLGNRLVKDLQPADVTRFLAQVERGDTATTVKTRARGRAVVKGGAGTAARTVGLLQGILTYAIGQRIRSDNPAHGIALPRAVRRERILAPAEYAALGRELASAMRGKANPWAIGAVRFIALTGARRGEALGLRKDAIDGASRTVTHADSKTGRSVRPLAAAALAVVGEVPKLAKSPYVFPALRGEGKHLTGVAKFFRGICGKAKLQGVTPHTLRHSLASLANNELKFSEATIAALLGHARHSVTSRYIHTIDAHLLAAADAVADRIAAMMGDKTRRQRGQVVPLRR